MVAKSQEDKLVLRRTYSASPATVYQAWTTPEQMRQWLRPSSDYTHTTLEFDLRIGGTYRINFESPEGKIDVVAGEFLEIIPGERLVYSWMWEKPNEYAGVNTQVTVEFRTAEKGTELVLTQVRFCDTSMKEQHMKGWTGTLDLLHKVVEE